MDFLQVKLNQWWYIRIGGDDIHEADPWNRPMKLTRIVGPQIWSKPSPRCWPKPMLRLDPNHHKRSNFCWPTQSRCWPKPRIFCTHMRKKLVGRICELQASSHPYKWETKTKMDFNIYAFVFIFISFFKINSSWRRQPTTRHLYKTTEYSKNYSKCYSCSCHTCIIKLFQFLFSFILAHF